MKINYICPFWGSDHLDPKDFVREAKEAGYDGVEVNVADDESFTKELLQAIKDNNVDFIAQQWLPPANESVAEYQSRMSNSLRRLATLQPLFINSHTGKDFFSFEENAALIKECQSIENETGINIVHETHRGRFNHHSASTIPFLEAFPDLKLNADFSHFTNVSESLLVDQEHILAKIIPHCHYIHARVGHDQSAQVNDPFASEWETHLKRFTSWWQAIVDQAKIRRIETFYICPEFGPAPYIQALPYTQKPTVDQWEINVKMMNYLRNKIS